MIAYSADPLSFRCDQAVWFQLLGRYDHPLAHQHLAGVSQALGDDLDEALENLVAGMLVVLDQAAKPLAADDGNLARLEAYTREVVDVRLDDGGPPDQLVGIDDIDGDLPARVGRVQGDSDLEGDPSLFEDEQLLARVLRVEYGDAAFVLPLGGELEHLIELVPGELGKYGTVLEQLFNVHLLQFRR